MDRSVADNAALLRTYGAVVILGAGISYALGYPLIRELPNLLWKSVDADPALLDAIARELGVPTEPAVRLIGTELARIERAFALLSMYPMARRTFQESFSDLDTTHVNVYSPAHDALAELVHRRAVSLVVSLNWDTLLEAAYRRRYGVPLLGDDVRLSKPHGDVGQPATDWVLPFAGGYVPDTLRARIAQLRTGQPGLLVIVGYSEGDDAIVDEIIAPIADQWRVVRVGPGTIGERNIALSAATALPAVLTSAFPEPETPGWEHATFASAHTLGDALAGRGLGPADVRVCAELPEVETAYQRLLTASSVAIVGNSGCGKSLTAYQVAHRFNQRGFEVLRLVQPAAPAQGLLAAVMNTPYPSLLLVDDAQAADAALIRLLIEHAHDHLKVLLVSTSPISGHHDSVAVVGTRAVRAIADDFLRRRDVVLSLVGQLDPTVGDDFMQIDITARIEHAASVSKAPWQFCFALTGGWRRAREQVLILREADRADLLLGAIAARQIVNLDAGADGAWLGHATRLCGRDPAWELSALAKMRDRRLLVEEAARVSCLHRLFAEVVLADLARDTGDPQATAFGKLATAAMGFGAPPLAGIAALLTVLHRTDSPQLSKRTLLDDQVYATILLRCWNARSSRERGDAAHVLDALQYWRSDFFAALAANVDLLGRWIQGVDRDSARGLGALVNGLVNSAPQLAMDICRHADPAMIAGMVSRTDRAGAYDLGHFIGRLRAAAAGAPFHEFGDPDWLQRLRGGLDIAALEALAASITPEDVPAYCELNENILNLEHESGLRMLYHASSAIARAFEAAPLQIYSSLHPFLMAAKMVDSAPPEQAVIARLFAAIDPAKVGSCVSASLPRDWFWYRDLFRWFEIIAPDFMASVYAEINFQQLDANTRGLWSAPAGNLNLLIVALGLSSTGEPARSWVNRHTEELAEVTGEIAAIAPEAAIAKLEQGLSLDLGPDHFHHWERAARALYGLARVDPAVAEAVAETNHVAFARGFTAPPSDVAYWDILPFLQCLETIAPDAYQKSLDAVDPAEARLQWAALLQGSPAQRLGGQVLLNAAASSRGSLATVARELMEVP